MSINVNFLKFQTLLERIKTELTTLGCLAVLKYYSAFHLKNIILPVPDATQYNNFFIVYYKLQSTQIE